MSCEGIEISRSPYRAINEDVSVGLEILVINSHKNNPLSQDIGFACPRIYQGQITVNAFQRIKIPKIRVDFT